MYQLVDHTRYQVYELWIQGVFLRDSIVAGTVQQEQVRQWARRMSILAEDQIAPTSRGEISPHVNQMHNRAPSAGSLWAAARALEDLLRPGGERACLFVEDHLAPDDLAAFLETALKVNRRAYGLGTTLSTLETIRAAGLTETDGRRALASAVDRGLARYRLEDAQERFTINDASEITETIDELRAGGPMLVVTISIVFHQELSPDYREVIRGVAHRQRLTVADVRLSDDHGLDVDLEFAGDDEVAFNAAVEEVRSRLPRALSVARVQTARGGDTYVAGQVGAQGPGATASGNLFVQQASSVDPERLFEEMEGLLARVKQNSGASSDSEEVAALVLAKGAVKRGHLSRAWEAVGTFGKSFLIEAQKAGLPVLAAWLKEKLGLHG